jgi:hypothetical protein
MMAWHTGGTTEKTPLIGGGFQTIFNFFYPALQRKFHLCIPFLRIARPQSPFPHSCVCERFILYSQDQSTYLAAAKYTDRSWKYL